jgi:hypothetical protein
MTQIAGEDDLLYGISHHLYDIKGLFSFMKRNIDVLVQHCCITQMMKIPYTNVTVIIFM